MKHLKTYKIYESNTLQSFREEVDDLLLPFSDLGYNIENRLGPGGVFIHFGSDMVNFKEIKEDLLRLLEYISNSVPNWKIDVSIKVTDVYQNERPIIIELNIDKMIQHLNTRKEEGFSFYNKNIDEYYVYSIFIEPLS